MLLSVWYLQSVLMENSDYVLNCVDITSSIADIVHWRTTIPKLTH